MDSTETQGAVGGAAQGAQSGAQIGGPYGAIIGGVLGGAAGLGLGSGVSEAQTNYENAMERYLGQLQNTDMPTYQDLKLALTRYSQGQPLTLQQTTALQQANSEVSKVQQNQQDVGIQQQALSQLMERAKGGLTLQDKADLLNAQRTIDQNSVAQQKGIVANLAARGQGGSGAELAARLQGNQQNGQLASQNALNVAAQSRAGALSAIQNAATQARTMGLDQYNSDYNRANALDQLNKQNLERQQQALQYNVSTQNSANMYNTQRANQISDANTNVSNQEQEANKQQLVNDYNRRIGRVQMLNGVSTGIAQNKLGNAQNAETGTLQQIGGIGNLYSGISGAINNKAQPTDSSGTDPKLANYTSSFGFGNYNLNQPNTEY